MLSSAPTLMGVAFLVAFGLVISACTLPTPDSGCCNEDNGDRYVSSSVPLQRTTSPDSRVDASQCFNGYSLVNQMAEAAVIVRARFMSATTGVEVWDPGNEIREALGTPDEITYFGTVEHTFDVVEYLKGTGGDEVVGVVVARFDGHVSREDAKQDALQLLDERDKRWDGREALLFLNAAHSHFVEFPRDDRYMLGSVSLELFNCSGGYTIGGQFGDKRLLPAASAALGASTAGGSGRFLLDYPGRFGPYEWLGQHRPAPSITLSRLKTMIKSVEGCSQHWDYREFYDCIGPEYRGYPGHLLDS